MATQKRWRKSIPIESENQKLVHFGLKGAHLKGKVFGVRQFFIEREALKLST